MQEARVCVCVAPAGCRHHTQGSWLHQGRCNPVASCSQRGLKARQASCVQGSVVSILALVLPCSPCSRTAVQLHVVCGLSVLTLLPPSPPRLLPAGHRGRQQVCQRRGGRCACEADRQQQCAGAAGGAAAGAEGQQGAGGGGQSPGGAGGRGQVGGTCTGLLPPDNLVSCLCLSII